LGKLLCKTIIMVDFYCFCSIFLERLKSLGTFMDFEFIINKIKEHLEDCVEFDFFEFEKENGLIKCNCGEKLEFKGLSPEDEKKLEEFLNAANLFSYSIRENAISKFIPIDEIISPLLGICI